MNNICYCTKIIIYKYNALSHRHNFPFLLSDRMMRYLQRSVVSEDDHAQTNVFVFRETGNLQ